jgi:hypothetical protein
MKKKKYRENLAKSVMKACHRHHGGGNGEKHHGSSADGKYQLMDVA